MKVTETEVPSIRSTRPIPPTALAECQEGPCLGLMYFARLSRKLGEMPVKDT